MAETTPAAEDLARIPLSELAARLGTGPEGLSGAEADRRLAADGPNAIAEAKTHPLVMFLSYFWAPIPWLIEVALVLSLILQHWPDVIIIAVLLLMNGFVGFYEEHQAADTIAALKKSLATTAHVRRDGNWVDVPVAQLVIGDLIHVALGDVVPADVRILDDAHVSVDQSALTGESLPASRTTGEQLYSGSILTRGQANALVYATGADSFFGKTTALVQSAGTVSHFQQAVLRIGKILIYAALILVAVTTASSLLHEDSWLDAVEFGLVVVIASVPVAMPAVLSVTMAVGARELAKQQAVVSHLPAVEELGGIDVLCTDKTGTLTQNRIQAGQPWSAPGVTVAQLTRAAVLASSPDSKDAIDLAVRALVTDPQLIDRYTVTAFTPFDPTVKRTQADVATPAGTTVRYAKGAPQVIETLCDGEDLDTVTAYRGRVKVFAARGDRSLGVAQSLEGNTWRLLGLLPLSDPPREDSASTIAAAIDLGVQVKMVTGDALAIGRQIADQVGIGNNLLPASRLDSAAAAVGMGKGAGRTDAGTSPAVSEMIEHADGFAQVFPEHKYLIVKALQARGHIRGHDRRRCQRRARAETGRCRHRRLGRHRRRPCRRRCCPARTGPVGDRAGDPVGAGNVRPDDQLHHLPHRRNHPGPAAGHHQCRRFERATRHRDHDRHSRPAQRRRVVVHRLRSRPRFDQAGALGHATSFDHCHQPGDDGCGRDVRVNGPGHRRFRAGRPARACDHPNDDLFETVRFRAFDRVRRTHPAPVLDPTGAGETAAGRRPGSADHRNHHRRHRVLDDPDPVGPGRSCLGVVADLVPDRRPGQNRRLRLAGTTPENRPRTPGHPAGRVAVRRCSSVACPGRTQKMRPFVARGLEPTVDPVGNTPEQVAAWRWHGDGSPDPGGFPEGVRPAPGRGGRGGMHEHGWADNVDQYVMGDIPQW